MNTHTMNLYSSLLQPFGRYTHREESMATLALALICPPTQKLGSREGLGAPGRQTNLGSNKRVHDCTFTEAFPVKFSTAHWEGCGRQEPWNAGKKAKLTFCLATSLPATKYKEEAKPIPSTTVS